MMEYFESGFELKAVHGTGVFEGYASVFSNVDHALDSVSPGAFARAIAERGAGGVKLLWQHDPAEPIGIIEELREDSRGLFVRGRLLTDVRRAREALTLMRKGALDGLSIGFRTIRSSTDEATGVRHLEEVDLWEISLVTFPMQPAARVSSFKADDVCAIGGFSTDEAKAASAYGVAGPVRQQEAGAVWSGLLHSLRRLEKTLRQTGERE